MRIFSVLLLLTLVAGLVPAGFATYAMLARFTLAGHVNSSSLAISVTNSSPSAGSIVGNSGECHARRARLWSCTVSDSSGSGVVDYNVRVRQGSSCWEGRLVHGRGYDMPRRVSGCVHRWQWSLLS